MHMRDAHAEATQLAPTRHRGHYGTTETVWNGSIELHDASFPGFDCQKCKMLSYKKQ